MLKIIMLILIVLIVVIKVFVLLKILLMYEYRCRMVFNDSDFGIQLQKWKYFVISECPPTEDGFERFACPSPDKEGRFRCIDDHVLCDGYIDCPNGDDEDRKNCFFFKTVRKKIIITNLIECNLFWKRERVKHHHINQFNKTPF